MKETLNPADRLRSHSCNEPKGYIFDYGGTLDTCGNHWGMVLWHGYQRHDIPVTEDEFREAYVFAERKLGREPIIKPDFTFRKTLATKLRLEMGYDWKWGICKQKACGTSANFRLSTSWHKCLTIFMPM